MVSDGPVRLAFRKIRMSNCVRYFCCRRKTGGDVRRHEHVAHGVRRVVRDVDLVEKVAGHSEVGVGKWCGARGGMNTVDRNPD